MKIGLPKLRLSRKLLLITIGMTILLGGTGVAALYFGGKHLGMEDAGNAAGPECTDVQTMVQKTPSNRLWLRRFIRMENASGPERVRTALRIAGLLAKKNVVDLIHVSVLDSHGPTLRSEMRARSIGAEVLIALKPDNLPDMKSPAMASYYEGPVNEEGRYYGDKVVVDIDEIGQMMTAMRSTEEKLDCVKPESAEDAEAKPNDHGKKEDKADHGKKQEHDAKPAEDHGEKPAEAHGEEPAKEGGEEHAKAEEPAKEQSFLDSMLGMVGLGGGEDKAAAPDMSHAVAEEPADATSQDHGEKTAADGHEPASEDASHAEKPAETAKDTHGETPGGDHDNKAADHADQPATDTTEHAAEDANPTEAKDAASTEDHSDTPVADHDAKVESHGEKPAAKTDDHSANDGGHAKKEGEEEAAVPVEHGDKAEAHADPSHPMEERAPASAEGDDHAEPVKKKSDGHALADMPVGD